METNLVWADDPKVREFLAYIGVDVDINRTVDIHIPTSGPIHVDENRFVKLDEIESDRTA